MGNSRGGHRIGGYIAYHAGNLPIEDLLSANRNLLITGGGQMTWGVSVNKFTWSKAFVIYPCGGLFTPDGVPIKKITIAANATGVTIDAVGKCLVVDLPISDNQTITLSDSNVVAADTITDPGKLIIAVRDEDSCLDLKDGGWVVYGDTVDAGGARNAYLRNIANSVKTTHITDLNVTTAKIANGAVDDTKIGNRTVDQAIATAFSNTGTLTQLLSWYAKQLKAITGATNWSDTPAATLSALNTGKLNLSGGTMTGALTLSADPTVNLHAATKQYVDARVLKSGDTLTGFLTLHSDPTNALHAATKQYVDGLVMGMDIKASCRVATTANITLSGTQTIDGIAVVAGDRVLVKDQTTASQNGIYVVAAGAWTRATDADSGTEIHSSIFTFVEQGTSNADTGWVLITDGSITIGTTSLTFVQFTGAGQITAGTGLTKSGNTLSLANLGTAGTYTKVTVDAQGRVSSATTLSAADIPNLDWAKITTGRPTTLSGYGISDAYTKVEVDTRVNQDVRNTSSPTFVSPMITSLKMGGVSGAELVYDATTKSIMFNFLS